MKILTALTLTSLLFLFGCGVTDDPPSDEDINQLNVDIVMSQGSEEEGITCMFTYSLPLLSDVVLKIEDSEGNETIRIDTTQQPGNYAVSLDANTYPDGEYWYELLAEPVDGSENLRSTGSFVIER